MTANLKYIHIIFSHPCFTVDPMLILLFELFRRNIIPCCYICTRNRNIDFWVRIFTENKFITMFFFLVINGEVADVGPMVKKCDTSINYSQMPLRSVRDGIRTKKTNIQLLNVCERIPLFRITRKCGLHRCMTNVDLLF